MTKAPQFKQLRNSYGFDEVAIVPGDVTVNPDQTNIELKIGDKVIPIPIIASAMDAVTDVNFAILMSKLGGLAVLNLDGVQTRYDNPAEILASEALSSIITELKKRFDIILFDSPPVLPVADAALLAARVDTVVLCYEIGKMSKNALLRAKAQLEATGARIAGVVLNRIAPQAEAIEPYPSIADTEKDTDTEETPVERRA